LTYCRVYLSQQGKIMSYREKSISVSLLITLYIWSNYTWGVINLYQHALLSIEAINRLLLSAVLSIILLEIVIQSVVTIFKYKEANVKSDERDKVISRRANTYAYKFLALGVFYVIFYILFPQMYQFTLSIPDLPKEYEILHLVIAFALLAEVISALVKLISYRRGY
jgi:hypothetical protein